MTLLYILMFVSTIVEMIITSLESPFNLILFLWQFSALCWCFNCWLKDKMIKFILGYK